MDKIYSRANSGKLLHVIYRLDDIVRQGTQQRYDLTPQDQSLQAAALLLPAGRVVKAHIHLPQERETGVTQELMVVMMGALKASFYDLDQKLLKETELYPGDLCITFGGGHRFEATREQTMFYEVKTGPYRGVEKDKSYIE
jgi:hypothetical protein